MRHSPILAFLIILLCMPLLHGQVKTVTYLADPGSVPPNRPVTLNHVDASLSFQPLENGVTGDVTISFSPNRFRTDSLVFDAPSFTLKALDLEGKPCQYRQDGPSLILFPPVALKRGKEYKVRFRYDSKPLTGPVYFVGWRPDEAGKRKQIWAHRPNGWLPYADGRVTTDVRITFDRHYTVFTNGERVGVQDNPDGTRTWHYRMTKDHPYFSTALAIGDYDYVTSSTDRGIPIEFLYYQGMSDRVRPTYQHTEQMFRFFERETGVPYPYPVYREIPVIDYMYGGMECTTSTIFGDYMLIDPGAYWQRNFINVNAHELAHQWYGDGIAHLAPRDVWLTESFGTYYAKIFEKSIFGEDQYESEMNSELGQALAAAQQNNYPVGSTMGGVARIYQKGSLVLGMLRYVMGDSAFQDAIRSYTRKYLFGYAQTSDFIRCVYEATGTPYDWFFDEWILRGGEPEYHVSWSASDDTAGRRTVSFDVYQVQQTSELVGLFRMPVVFEVDYTDGTRTIDTAWISDQYDRVTIPDPGRRRVSFCLFDPGRNVVKKVIFPKKYPELSAQALGASHMIDRYDALVALRDFPVPQKRGLLDSCYYRETFYLTKAEIIRQLAKDSTPESYAIVLDAVQDRDANVRKAALLQVNPIPDMLREPFEALLADSSYLNCELALDALCRDFPSEKNRYLGLTSEARGWRGLNIRMKWLEIAIGSGQKEYLPELIAYTSPEFEFETRMNSLTTLKKLGYLDPVAAQNAITAALHWNSKLSGTGKEVLTWFYQQDRYRFMIDRQMDTMELNPLQRQAVIQVLKPKS
jgi:aminopeptidase N